MSTEPEFQPWQKIHRLNREIIITEKIDGTNGLVHVSDDGEVVRAGSRSRWITPEQDNHGFAKWVRDNTIDLRNLGPGYHHGEWWGAGIQRRYGLSEKRFSLFNTYRWGETRPLSCWCVPILYQGPYTPHAVDDALDRLSKEGSLAAPGFMEPEGVVIFHVPSQYMLKVTLEGDLDGYGKDGPK